MKKYYCVNDIEWEESDWRGRYRCKQELKIAMDKYLNDSNSQLYYAECIDQDIEDGYIPSGASFISERKDGNMVDLLYSSILHSPLRQKYDSESLEIEFNDMILGFLIENGMVSNRGDIVLYHTIQVYNPGVEL